MTLFQAITTAVREWRGSSRPQKVENVTYSDAVMESFGVVPSAAGMPVNATSAMRVSAVSACVQKIAGTISTLRLDILRQDDENEVRLPRDDLWYKLNEQPSIQFTATSHWENVLRAQLLRGDGYTWIRRSANNSIRELLPLPWGSVSPLLQNDGSVRYYVSLPQYGIQTWLSPYEVLHFPGHGFDGLKSMSVIAYGARAAVGNALAMDEYSGKFFANGAHPSIVLKTEHKMSDDQIARLQTAFANKYAGIDNAHRIPLVLIDGMDAKEISLSAEDAQLLEARKFQVTDIARAFGVPPHMIGETSGSSAVGAGYEQQGRDFVTHTLRLHLKRLEQELNRKLFPRDTGRFVRFDLSDLIEGDSKAQADYNRAALGGPGTGMGWQTPNEIRKTKGLAPLDSPEANQLFDPRSMKGKNENPTTPA